LSVPFSLSPLLPLSEAVHLVGRSFLRRRTAGPLPNGSFEHIMLSMAMRRRNRVYIDTSVLGALFDEEFRESTTAFFEQARQGRFEVVVSALAADEVALSPKSVQDFYTEVMEYAETVTPSRQAILLQRAYLDAGVVSSRWSNDALHVATATVTECDMIVSWNFRHIVHYDKKRKYNAVNALNGYGYIDILTPAEVIEYEEDV
jgi:predicted nucleic acid-binding protein